jgi:lipoyl-dependent peroxiredoxin subunit D
MNALDVLREQFPDWARDVKLNLQSVLQGGTLTEAQRWGVAVTAAVTSRNVRLREATLVDARSTVDATVIEDALAAASLMAMNNVYYRFRHMIEKPAYSEKPPRLRMNRLAKPASNKIDLELFSLAASAINACEMCIKAHEKIVLEGGLTEDHIHDTIRIAAVFHAAAVTLDALEVQRP